MGPGAGSAKHTLETTLLCVDDQPEALEVRKVFLEAFGYRVLVVDEKAAIDVLGAESVDLVLLDYKMAEMTGDELAREIRRRWPRLPILMLAGYATEVPEAARTAVDGVIAKDEVPSRLLGKIAALTAALPGGRTGDSLLTERKPAQQAPGEEDEKRSRG